MITDLLLLLQHEQPSITSFSSMYHYDNYTSNIGDFVKVIAGFILKYVNNNSTEQYHYSNNMDHVGYHVFVNTLTVAIVAISILLLS